MSLGAAFLAVGGFLAVVTTLVAILDKIAPPR